jgi:hypothetical protein
MSTRSVPLGGFSLGFASRFNEKASPQQLLRPVGFLLIQSGMDGFFETKSGHFAGSRDAPTFRLRLSRRGR